MIPANKERISRISFTESPLNNDIESKKERASRISFTRDAKERQILNKFETGETVIVNERTATITKCPDLDDEKYTVVYLDSKEHEQETVEEEDIRPVSISVGVYTSLVLFSSMDFISDIVYALFSEFHDENLRAVAIFLLFTQFSLFIVFDVKKFVNVLILILYCKDVKERLGKYLTYRPYDLITSVVSREYYMHWLPLWDAFRFMLNFQNKSNLRPQYFFIKENADLKTESAINIGYLEKNNHYKFETVLGDNWIVSSSTLKLNSDINPVHILKPSSEPIESSKYNFSLFTSCNSW